MLARAYPPGVRRVGSIGPLGIEARARPSFMQAATSRRRPAGRLAGVAPLVASLFLGAMSLASPACSARKLSITTYDDGRHDLEIESLGPARDGRCVQFFPDGKPALETRYRLGLRDGSWRVWHANGRLAVEGAFVRGLREGPWTEWSPAGTKLLEGSWVDGEKSGTWLEYDDSGRLIARETFVDGTRLSRVPG